jgi:peptidoglycan/LPS O-acetylase OafA/YrhL
MSDASYRADIDGLRGVAVAAVVLFHAFPAALPGGFVGVDVFFVISGFLITSLIVGAMDEGRFSLAHFYARRIRRLFPALILVLAASLGAGWYILSTESFVRLGGHAAAASAFVSNLVFWRESGYFEAAAGATPLLHLWSLGVEEQFYLTWPVLLALFARRLNVTVITALLMAVSFTANIAVSAGDPADAFYLPHTRAWELLAGAWLALRLRSRAPLPRWLGAAGLALIALSLVVIGEDQRFPGWWALGPVVGACLVIAAGPVAPVNRLLSSRALVVLGLISYPLYLWHWPILAFARLSLVEPASPLLVVGLIVLAVGLAWMTQSLVEAPIRFGRLRHSVTAVAVLVVCAAGVGAAGAATADGRIGVRSNRFDSIVGVAYDYARAYRGGVCQLSTSQSPAAFAASCVDQDFARPGKTRVLLWGDSHAAHLYPGLRALAGDARIALAQFTADGCAPLVDEPTPFCRGVHDLVQTRVTALRPDAIVLAADWTAPKVERLVASVGAIRRLSSAPIIVVGPVPQWGMALPQQLVVFSQRHPSAAAPSRLRDGLDDGRFALDSVIRRLDLGPAVHYVSAIGALCNDEGCLAVVDGQLTAFDAAHLTDVGSHVVAEAVLATVGALP